MTKERTRFAVVGTGAISQIVHVPILAERQDVDLVVLADADPHKARSVAQRFDVAETVSPDEVLGRDDIDAVVLATPPAYHEDFAVAALEAGKHVLVERPLALSAQGVERALAAAEKAERHLSVGLPHRYRPEVTALRSFVAGGELGEPYAVKGSWLIRHSPVKRTTWRQRRADGGGVLHELGVPALDLCLGVVGYPEVERLTCHLTMGAHEVAEAAFIMAYTTSGMTVTVEVSNAFFSSDDRQYVRVLGSEGSGELPPLEVYRQLGGRPLDVTPRQPRPQGGENPYTNAYRRQIDHFVRGIQGVAEIKPPTEQSALMRLVEAAFRSAEDGTEVAL